MIHDLLPGVVDALTKYGKMARGTVEKVVGLDKLEGGGE